MVVTVLEKVYGPFHPQMFEPMFLSLCRGLKVNLKIVGSTDRGWVQIDVSGEDRVVALRYIDQQIGLAPASVDKVKKFSTIRGRVIASGKSKNELYVDIGVFSPRIHDAAIPLRTVQAQLGDGKKIPLQRIIELFCLRDNLPLEVKIVDDDIPSQKGLIEAELSEGQLSEIAGWIHSQLDRLIVLGAPISEIKYALKASRHTRDIIKIETLGLLEHAILCKLGTDAIGLIPKLGRFLPTATLMPFQPRKIQKLVNRPVL